MCRNMAVLTKAYRNYYTKLWIVNIDHKKQRFFKKVSSLLITFKNIDLQWLILNNKYVNILYIIPIYPNNLIFPTYACKKNDKQLYLY